MSALLDRLHNGVTAAAVSGVKGLIKARGAAGVVLDKSRSTRQRLVDAARAEIAERDAVKTALMRKCDEIVQENFDQVLQELTAGRTVPQKGNEVVLLEIADAYRSFILDGLMEQQAYEEKQAKASALFLEQAQRLLAKVELRLAPQKSASKSRKA
jgi:hypothetical protein